MRISWRSFIIIGIVLILVDAFRPQLLGKDLEHIDQEKYKVAIGIKNNPNFTGGEVKFLVCYGPLMLIFKASTSRFYRDTILLSPLALMDKDFDATIAHELGHIEYGHSWNSDLDKAQIEADTFAAKIVGKKRLRNIRLASGFSKNHPLVKNLEN